MAKSFSIRLGVSLLRSLLCILDCKEKFIPTEALEAGKEMHSELPTA
jgi:hypothetical protein